MRQCSRVAPPRIAPKSAIFTFQFVCVRNDPANFIDPDGRETCLVNGEPVSCNAGYDTTIVVTPAQELTLMDSIPHYHSDSADELIYVDGSAIGQSYFGFSLGYLQQGLAMVNAGLAQANNPTLLSTQSENPSKHAGTQKPLDVALKWKGTNKYKKCNEVVYYSWVEAGYSGPCFNSKNFPNTKSSPFTQQEADAVPEKGDILVWRGNHISYSLGGDDDYGWRTSEQAILPGKNMW